MKSMFGAGSLAAALAMPAVAAAAPAPSIDWHGESTLLHDAPGFRDAAEVAGRPGMWFDTRSDIQLDIRPDMWPEMRPDSRPAACLDDASLPACAAAPLSGNDDGAVSATGPATVPEPGAWSMLLAGGALLGLAKRRRTNEKFS